MKKKKSNAGRKPTGAGKPFPCRIREDIIVAIRAMSERDGRTIRSTTERALEAHLRVFGVEPAA